MNILSKGVPSGINSCGKNTYNTRKKKYDINGLSRKMNMSRQNLNNKMKRNNFSEKEIADLANALEKKNTSKSMFTIHTI